MSNDTKCNKMSNDTKRQMTQNVKWHKMSNDKTLDDINEMDDMTHDIWHMTHESCQPTCNVNRHVMSIDMKCQMSWDVKFHGAKCPPGTHLLILGIFSNRNWFWTLIPWWIWWLWLLWWLRSPRSHEMLTDMICRPTWNIKYHEMSNVKCHEILVLWPQAETPGVTHFGAYHRPPDGHFYNSQKFKEEHHQGKGNVEETVQQG